MELKPSNSDILDQLRHGSARFELVSLLKSTVSDSNSSTFLGSTQRKSHLFFAKTIRIPSQIFEQNDVERVTNDTSFSLNRSTSLGPTKVKQYNVTRVIEDSRSLFRALAEGIAKNEGCAMDPYKLQKDVKDVLCNNHKEKYNEAVAAITVKESLNNYCQRFGGEDFWGGNSELLVLSKLYEQPIKVYLYEDEHASGVLPIAEYGAEFQGRWLKGKKNVVRLLYNVETNHYDLLH